MSLIPRSHGFRVFALEEDAADAGHFLDGCAASGIVSDDGVESKAEEE